MDDDDGTYIQAASQQQSEFTNSRKGKERKSDLSERIESRAVGGGAEHYMCTSR